MSTVRVYTPESRLRHPARLLVDLMRDVLSGRELAWRLAVRDVSAQYRQTALGFLWAFILPVSSTLVWVFLNRAGVVEVSETTLPYAAWVFSGTILWAILTDAVNAPLQQVTSARSMLTKINFPREALILSGILQALFNGGIRIAVLLVALLVMGIHPGWNLLLFPFAVLSLILAGTAAGLLVTPLGMLYSDVGRSLPLLMQFLMYLSPVVFPIPQAGVAATVFEWNPATPLILTARDWLTGVPAEHVPAFLAVNGALLLLLLGTALLYRLAMPILIERMGA